MYVLIPDGSIYICKNMNILEVIWAYEFYKMLIRMYDDGHADGLQMEL
jgi:hypothetical protein